MTSKTNKGYTINKGIGKSISFKGLKAQYIWYLAGAVLGNLILFAILYIAWVCSWLCVLIALGLGTASVMGVYRMSQAYGEFGLMKKKAAKHIPKSLRSYSRKGFIRLKPDHGKDIDGDVAGTRSVGGLHRLENGGGYGCL